MPFEKVDTVSVLFEGHIVEPKKIIISIDLLYDYFFLQYITKIINLQCFYVERADVGR